MKSFQYFAPTQIIFGEGTAAQLGEIAAEYGKRALLVTERDIPAMAHMYRDALASLQAAGLETERFDGVIPNPTTDSVSAGAAMAREFKADVVIGFGGGSAMDTAKAIAVEATHPGSAWDYLHYTSGPSDKTLPIIAVGTTAGTGSQTTPCAVITRTIDKDKSAIWHKNIFPKVAIVDPLLTSTMPPHITAQTGFDAFCHNFEALISVNSNPLVKTMALDAIERIAEYLPRAVADGSDREARMQMAWADTLGGLTNASAGVTLPHGLGMQVGGHCPMVTHGQALAAIYPAFTRFTWAADIENFAAVGRILAQLPESVSAEEAAKACCTGIDKLLQDIGLFIGFNDLGVTEADLKAIAACGQVLGDYKNNPRVATLKEMHTLLMACQTRQEVQEQ